MTEQCENIKAELHSNHYGLTALAQLVAIYTSAGISSAAEIAKLTGYTPRSIFKAIAELRCSRTEPEFTTAEPEFMNPASATEPRFIELNPASCTRVQSSRAYIESPTEIDILKEVKKKKITTNSEKSRRGSRLDAEWRLPDDWRMWSKTNFPASNDQLIDEQAEIFRDYWISKPGAIACKLDWEATWRNWCRKGLSQAGSVRQPQYTGSYGAPSKPVSRDRLTAIYASMQAQKGAPAP